VDSSAGFPDIEFIGCNGGDGICSPGELATSIAWGTPVTEEPPFGGRSGASINVLDDNTDPGGTPDPGKVGIPPGSPPVTVFYEHQPLNEWNVLGSLTHWNRRIEQFNFLGEVDVDYTIEITDSASGEMISINEIFPVDFFETLNTATIAGCDPTPNPSGSDIPCDDWFDFENTIDEKFVLGGTEYLITIKGFCAQGEDPETCVPGRLYTAEQEDTVGFVYEIKQVPAPGVLALVGVGLAGLGYARRRQVKA
jgi:hypothetical protein